MTDSKKITHSLTIILLVGLTGLGVITVYPISLDEPTTEFYVLGPSGDATAYPDNLTVSETGTFIVGVTNHERSETTYTLVLSEGESLLEQRQLTIDEGNTWERKLTYSPDSAGQKQVQLKLYKGSEAVGDPYRSLRLVIEVTE